jgi:hypothetical protein
MANRVAVQDGLENVERALREQGFEVTNMQTAGLTDVCAIVVTGMHDRIMGITDLPDQAAPVIQAAGLTADEVVRIVQDRAAAKNK